MNQHSEGGRLPRTATSYTYLIDVLDDNTPVGQYRRARLAKTWYPNGVPEFNADDAIRGIEQKRTRDDWYTQARAA